MQSKLAILLLLALLVSGCTLGAASPTPTFIPPTETLTPAPTFTPTPSTPLAILVLPADMDQATSALYQKTVYDLAQASGFRFQVRNALSPADVADSTLKVVIALPPDPGIATLAPAAPQAQFLAVDIPNVSAGGNVSVLSNNSQEDISAFMAGYVAAMITSDYHIGMLIPKDNADAQRALAAYTNGMSFYCGMCRPFYYVDWSYPQSLEIPADEDKSRYGAYADYLITQKKVDTIYVYPDIATTELLTYIGTDGGMSIANTAPDPLPPNFVMSMQPDTIKAIQSAWPDLVAGKGGVNVQAALALANVDPTLLTPGKQRLAEQTLQDLQAGLIDPASH